MDDVVIDCSPTLVTKRGTARHYGSFARFNWTALSACFEAWRDPEHMLLLQPWRKRIHTLGHGEVAGAQWDTFQFSWRHTKGRSTSVSLIALLHFVWIQYHEILNTLLAHPFFLVWQQSTSIQNRCEYKGMNRLASSKQWAWLDFCPSFFLKAGRGTTNGFSSLRHIHHHPPAFRCS